ncbi:phosphate/phosphite/phosphonate ABC transporter substrate-binding protein [bacterium]|nr:phosphate/phosphite/phosphonate ABC transporter substrate-binding protein [bacterium]
MHRLLHIALLLSLLTAGCYKPEAESHALGSEKNPLTMAFVPSTEAEKVVSSGDELCELLSAETGLHFRSMVATSYVGIVEAMAADKVQVGWLPPMAYVFAHERNGDQAILKVVRHGKSSYRGQILVGSDSGIENITDLKGRRIAYPEQASTSGHLYPATLLIEAGLDPEVDLEESYSGSHDAAVLALAKGSVDAACCFEDARQKLVDNGMDELMQSTRVLAYTPEIPADNVSVTAGLDPELTARIRDGLLALAASEEGKRVLFELYEVEGLVTAADSDYDPVRNMANLLGLDIEKEID